VGASRVSNNTVDFYLMEKLLTVTPPAFLQFSAEAIRRDGVYLTGGVTGTLSLRR
jgi:hypothetical protein